MKKIFLGATLGVVAGAVGYKMYKENEEKIIGFLAKNFDNELDIEDIDLDDITLEDLEELRNCIDEMIDAKLDAEYEGYEEDEDYILINDDEYDEEDEEDEEDEDMNDSGEEE